MGLTSYCRNCGQNKTPDFYAENFCAECTQSITAARAHAAKEGLDPGLEQRRVLAQRAHDTHRGRANPLSPWDRAAFPVPGVPDGPPPN